MTSSRSDHDLRLVPAALVCWAGAAWWVESPSAWALGSAGLALAAAVCWRRRAAVVATACVIAAIAVSCAWRVALVEGSPVTVAAAQGRVGTFELTVRRDAHVFDRHGRTQAVVDVVVDRYSIGGEHGTVHVTATAFVDGPVDDLVVGRRFTAHGRLEPADTRRAAAVLDVTRRERAAAAGPVWEAADRIRRGVRDAAAPLPSGPRALLPALVDGDTTRVDERMDADFRRTGLTHLMAVSGTNLTIVLGLVLALTRARGARRATTWIVAALTVAAFVAVARPDPSVLRAAAMGLVGVAALGFGRPGGLRALSVAIVALLFLDPWLSRSAGFILSVSATGGILLLGPPFTRRLSRWMPTWGAIAVAVPLAAQVACTPTLAALSGEVSLVAVVANVLAGPVVAPATVLGLVGGLLAVVWVPLGQVVAWPAGACAAWIVEIAERGAAVAGASVVWSAPWQVLLVVVPLVTVGLWFAAARPVVAIGLAIGLTVGVLRPPHPGWPPESWVMVACDVGQGDATVLNAGDGDAVLVDAGPDPGPLDRCLDQLAVERIVLVVITHDHADHGGGRIGRWADVTVGGPSSTDLRQLEVGERFTAGDVQVDVLWPTSRIDPGESDGSAINDASVVLRARIAGTTVLLTGDVEPDAQEALLRSGQRVDAQVLKMPHHGSARQSEPFLDAVGARVATISAGADNDYGHPAPAALAMLHDRGISAWRTDLHGDIAVVRRSTGLAVVTRR